MPTLEWIGKDKVVNHHLEVPYRVLEERYTYNAEQSENMIIRGDNLEALKALLPRYEGPKRQAAPVHLLSAIASTAPVPPALLNRRWL